MSFRRRVISEFLVFIRSLKRSCLFVSSCMLAFFCFGNNFKSLISLSRKFILCSYYWHIAMCFAIVCLLRLSSLTLYTFSYCFSSFTTFSIIPTFEVISLYVLTLSLSSTIYPCISSLSLLLSLTNSSLMSTSACLLTF